MKMTWLVNIAGQETARPRTASAGCLCSALVPRQTSFLASLFAPWLWPLALDRRKHCDCVFAFCVCIFDVVFTLVFTCVLSVFTPATRVGAQPHACIPCKHRQNTGKHKRKQNVKNANTKRKHSITVITAV